MKKVDMRTSLVPGAEGREKEYLVSTVCTCVMFPWGPTLASFPGLVCLLLALQNFAQKTWFILSRDVCRRQNFMSHPVYSKYCRVAEISTNGVGKTGHARTIDYSIVNSS